MMKLLSRGLALAFLSAPLVFAAPALAKSAALKYAPDYSDMRGVNYTPASNQDSGKGWLDYSHAGVDRDLGYAERMRLNTLRTFVSYQAYVKDKKAFRANLIDYVRAANAHGMGVMVTLPAGVVGGPPSRETTLSPEMKANLRAFAQFLVDAVGNGKEPGLAIWDVANEPDFTKPQVITVHETNIGEVTQEIGNGHASPPNTDQPHNMLVARYMADLFHEFDHRTPVTVGCMMPTACLTESAKYVDILSFHDYSQTVAQTDANIALAKAAAAAVHKPVVQSEMACIGRADPYDISIEEHEKNHVGWIIFELTFTPGWAPVHGIVYPDGSIRDPSIVAAVLGFFRNRGPNVVLEQTDRESITSGVLDDARKWLADSKPDWFNGLVIAETEARTLEAGQLVGMRDLPTRNVYMLRAGPQNMPELRQTIQKFSEELAPNAITGQTPLHRFYTPAVPH
jgi:hypothetical protein